MKLLVLIILSLLIHCISLLFILTNHFIKNPKILYFMHYIDFMLYRYKKNI